MEELFKQWAGVPYENKIQMSANGSNRLYFRLEGGGKSCIAAVNQDVRENEAFFFFAKEMSRRGIRVPEVYAVSDDGTTYLQQDLGNVTLYTFLTSRKTNGVDITEHQRQWYRMAIDDLIVMQRTCSDIDFGRAYPRPAFDHQAILWDLNYWKYYFLRLFHIPFDEELLERDFDTFISFLLDGDCNCFMFRDFQSRNIMIVDEQLYYIDFQGARRGAPQYDLASLLYSSKSDLPDELRAELLEYYMERAEVSDTETFRKRFYGYVLARMMQAMGAYGFRGVIEKKEHFVKSIPFAVKNLRNILQQVELPVQLPHLMSVWQTVSEMPEYNKEKEGLSVSIFSFSYRKGIPFDKSGNGGGFVFDCRMLPNPGLFDEYKSMNGKDQEVIDFFNEHPEVDEFLRHVQAIVAAAVESYQSRGYTRLMLSFGCTGGRHRSVFCAERVAQFLRERYDISLFLHHVEQGKL